MRNATLVAIVVLTISTATILRTESVAHAHRTSRGDGYAEALQARARDRAATFAATQRAAAREREARFVARETARFCRLYGRRVARWYLLVHRYFPGHERGHAMLCISLESAGDPNALGAAGEIGLFQLKGFACRPWAPDDNVRLAATMWRAYGWSRWTTMRQFW